MKNINIISRQTDLIKDFLERHDFIINEIEKDLWQVSREHLDVFLKQSGNILFFEVDLGSTVGLTSEKFYKELLVLNTKILPVSLGVDNSNEKEERLILIESREVENLDNNELLSVFEALEIACLKVENLLNQFIKK